MGDLFGNTGGSRPGLGDLLGGIFGNAGGAGRGTRRRRRAASAARTSRASCGSTSSRPSGAPRCRSGSRRPGRCQTCSGSGARPGTHSAAVPDLSGTGLISRNEGAFAFSEPCPDCRGTGRIIDDPCPECHGDGISTRTRSLTVRVPAGVDDGQRIKLAGQGEPGRGGAPAGDLYVKVHVTPHRRVRTVEGQPGRPVVTVPVTYPELVLGSTIDGADARRLGHPADPGRDPEREDVPGPRAAACRSAPAPRATCSSRCRWRSRSGWTTRRGRR